MVGLSKCNSRRIKHLHFLLYFELALFDILRLQLIFDYFKILHPPNVVFVFLSLLPLLLCAHLLLFADH